MSEQPTTPTPATAPETPESVEIEKTKDGFKLHGAFWALIAVVVVLTGCIIAVMWGAHRFGLVK